MSSYLKEEPGGLVSLTVAAQPRASRSRVIGPHGDALKLAITAPPVEGKANEAIVALLAKLLKIPKSAIAIASGTQSRNKRLLIAGLSLAEIQSALDQTGK